MKKTILRRAVWLCVLLIVAFIFYNSAQPAPKSNETSASVAVTIAPLAPSAQGSVSAWYRFVNVVRKAAHLAEFFVLGTGLFAGFIVLEKPNVQAFWNVLSSAAVIAVTDESIQILSGRGARVQDVLLDVCGAAAAVLLLSVIYFAVRAIVRQYKKKKADTAVC